MFTKFTFREALLQLTRNRGRSMIMVFVSLLLCGCIAFYLGNITSSEQALASINESTPAILNICNAFGETRENLTIPTVYVDLLTASGGLRDMELTCQAAGAFSQEARDVDQRCFNGGDTELLGINRPEAMCSTEAERALDQRYITYLDGYGPRAGAGGRSVHTDIYPQVRLLEDARLLCHVRRRHLGRGRLRDTTGLDAEGGGRLLP